jgi:hypothetical protein
MPKKYNGDSTLIGAGNVEYRMESLLQRRRNAALTGQHRETQRYDKEIMLLRGALGLNPQPPKGEIHDQKTARDPSKGEGITLLENANDVDWLKKVTVRNLATMQKKLRDKGYNYNIEKAASITKHSWVGFNKGKVDNLAISCIGKDWVVSASRNDETLPLFIFNPTANKYDKGIPVEIATENWDGNLQQETKQKYAESWSQLLKQI